MASTPISFTPETQDLKFYGGDGVELTINVADGASMANLSGTIAAQIRASRVNPTVLASFAVDQTDAADGVVYLSLTGAQTAALHGTDPTKPVERFSGVWDVQWAPTTGRSPITLVQGSVESSLDVTRLP